MKKDDIENSQQSTGSAENIGKDRNTQKSSMADTNKNERENIARQAGLGRDRMIDIENLGGLSGRDDYAGGDSDDMSNENTNSETER